MQKDPGVMMVKDWIITQSKDPAIREIKYLINNKKLKGWKVYSQDPKITKQYLRQLSHLVLYEGVLYRWVTPSKEDQNALQPAIPPRAIKRKLYKVVMMTSDTWELSRCWICYKSDFIGQG